MDQLIGSGSARLATIDLGTEEFNLYRKLTTSPDHGHKIIGPGEAASIALAKSYNGVIASNNLRDIAVYIDEFELKHLTTGDILVEAFRKALISEDEGNEIWSSMLSKRRKLGASSFSEYLKSKLDDMQIATV